ncbi:sodium- and chloride-dependent neutral and basic amino acid transporter B(0+)-like [Hemiscyllium ocellatum]|uniref:sodium- and chloride-dependent neutral and basic amino acid transporter B(0+)-like n=1 Tax=Hemiscyllium ocellatum TaxID=170820 RepID=UPI002967077C|nr:sodium- and chloride-dependent neutral and basic amino acid transporter B(0+)-like [Hemiscyllium ocellatum]
MGPDHISHNALPRVIPIGSLTCIQCPFALDLLDYARRKDVVVSVSKPRESLGIHTKTPEDSGTNDKNIQRGYWALKTDYLFSVIGYTVGLGNVWRFPYLVYKNGGGAFLIPYIIMMAIAGLPMFFMESALGQFASLGPVQVWKAVPILQGMGLLTFSVSAFQGLYYNCIITYCLFYFTISFQSPLPWRDCYSWCENDKTCHKTPADPMYNVTSSSENNGNKNCQNSSYQKSRSEHFWDVVVLHRSSSINETGNVVWHLAICLLVTWLIILLVLCKGIKISGKVSYFTVAIPYIGLILLLIRGVTLEGAYNGIKYYFGRNSDFSKLADIQVWKDAATQIFFSLSVSLGGITALSSYNKFQNDCFTDTIIVGVINCLTSWIAGFAIFSTLGHVANEINLPVSEVSHSGLGLVFLAYPEALLHLPIAPLWSAIFFSMIVTIGLTSQFAVVETIITSLLDEFPKFLRDKRLYVTVIVCVILYLFGMLLVTQAGIYWIHLIDHFCSGWGLLLIALLEIIGLSWVYGINRFIKDIEMMIGERNWRFWLWWRACWIVVTPIVLMIILVWSIIIFKPLEYGVLEYPSWAVTLGWLMLTFCFIWVPVIAVIAIAGAEGDSLRQKAIAVLKPAPDWGPFMEQHRGERYKNKQESIQRLQKSKISFFNVVSKL